MHLRDPARLWRDLGPLKTASVLATFASGVLGPLLWPAFTGVVVWLAWSGTLLQPEGFVAIARSTLVCLLVLCGALAMIGPLVLGALRQDLRRYLVLLPLLPLWQIALCVASWTALVELFADPYRWAKTDHGLAKRRGPMASAAPLCPEDQALRAIRPPSTGIATPVMKDAAGMHSDTVICATSSGVP